MTKTQYFEFGIKPSLFSGEPALSKNLFMRNKANFNGVKLTATSCCKKAYNDLSPKTKNGTNPNKANFKNAQFRLTLIAISVTVMPLSNSIRKEKLSNTKGACYV